MGQDSIKARLTEWLQTAQRLEEELNCLEPDQTLIQELLSRRKTLQQELERMALPGFKADPELCLFAKGCVDADRRALGKARARLAEAADELSRLKNRRAAAEGYRRAVIDAARNGVRFFDGRI